jgi:hypothetical protein
VGRPEESAARLMRSDEHTLPCVPSPSRWARRGTLQHAALPPGPAPPTPVSLFMLAPSRAPRIALLQVPFVCAQ